jgi:hypothetical protein
MLPQDWELLLRQLQEMGLSVVKVDKARYLVTVFIPPPKR